MTRYRIRGTFPGPGYHIEDCARAAGVELTYDTEEAAQAAAREIETTPDTDGVAPSCEVYEVDAS